MSEGLLHYVWANRLFPIEDLRSSEGERIEVLSTGFYNTDAGPDFFNAHIIIGGTQWIGNVEVHQRSSDWYKHRHQDDPAYDNVILHVVGNVDCDIFTRSGRKVAQLMVEVPDFVQKKYFLLQSAAQIKPCYTYAAGLNEEERKRWFDCLAVKRLERKAGEVDERLKRCGNDWERVFFITMARAFGFGLNSDAFERWAFLLPYSGAAKHRDNLFQIEALFFGTAGFLTASPYSAACSQKTGSAGQDYPTRLRNEFRFLSNKFSITPMPKQAWKFLRLRPQNFPTMRMAQLAALYSGGSLSLSVALEAENIKNLRQKLKADVSPFWQTHYSLSTTPESPKAIHRIQTPTLNLLIINGVIPVLYAYGRYRNSANLRNKAINWLHSLPAEDNRYTRLFQSQAFRLTNAFESQAVIQLLTTLCAKKDCLRCYLGRSFLRCGGQCPKVSSPTSD